MAVWDSGTGRLLSRLETTNQPIRRVAVSPDSQRLVAVAERLKIRRVLTLDRRHFEMIRPRHCASFEILP